MTLMQAFQILYVVGYASVLVACVPALFRLMINFKPLKLLDPVKVFLGFMSVCLINSFLIRVDEGNTFVTTHDTEWLIASGLLTASLVSTTVALFITERAIFRARSS